MTPSEQDVALLAHVIQLAVATMFALIAGILSFLREVYVATHTVKIGPPRERPAARP